jgi:hypothetical protein
VRDGPTETEIPAQVDARQGSRLHHGERKLIPTRNEARNNAMGRARRLRWYSQDGKRLHRDTLSINDWCSRGQPRTRHRDSDSGEASPGRNPPLTTTEGSTSVLFHPGHAGWSCATSPGSVTESTRFGYHHGEGATFAISHHGWIGPDWGETFGDERKSGICSLSELWETESHGDWRKCSTHATVIAPARNANVQDDVETLGIFHHGNIWGRVNMQSHPKDAARARAVALESRDGCPIPCRWV